LVSLVLCGGANGDWGQKATQDEKQTKAHKKKPAVVPSDETRAAPNLKIA
jgi:hypothetical protein